jgi:hypothetical protein
LNDAHPPRRVGFLCALLTLALGLAAKRFCAESHFNPQSEIDNPQFFYQSNK